MYLLRIASKRKKNRLSPSTSSLVVIILSLFLLMNNSIITRTILSSTTRARKNIFVTSFIPNTINQSRSSKRRCNTLSFLKNANYQNNNYHHTIATINSNRLFSSSASTNIEISSAGADNTKSEILLSSSDNNNNNINNNNEENDESTYHTPVMVKECIDALLSPPSSSSSSSSTSKNYKKKYRNNKFNDPTPKTTIATNNNDNNNNNSKRKIFIDGTLGGGGHSLELLKKLNPGDILFGCDVDNDAISNASNRLQKYMDNENTYPLFIPIQCNFCNVHDVLLKKYKEYFINNDDDDNNNTMNTNIVDGILLDLGISSYQIDTPDRGFTFMDNGPLDMRMSTNITLTASQICNEFSKNDLSYIFHTYGDETRHMSNIIASSIIYNRPLNTTNDLVDAIYKTNKVPKFHKKNKRKGLSSTSARIFQSLRIYVNKEDEVLEKALLDMVPKLLKRNNNGKLVILSYHSIEDRIVKRIMKHGTLDITKNSLFNIKRDLYGNEIINDHDDDNEESGGGRNKKQYKMIGKFIPPSEEEIDRNGRARSAKLRIAEKL